MTHVRILPEILSNQIAAGEVVERPASVVKELVENSIDAGASSITVEVRGGGKSLIRVSDDGVGQSRDDALLSIERYATSKIFSKEDLFTISTMGFRGEALPSIASVSRFTMITRTRKDSVGTKIEIAGGKVMNVSDAGAPVGTMVEVKNLFFNTPARKKFLKTDNTEISHISDIISGAALGNPSIRFRLFSNNRLQKSFPGSDGAFQRAAGVLGKNVSENLVNITYKDDYINIDGYAAHPRETRSSSAKVFLFVNGRLVQDRGVISAIFQGYKGRIMKGRFPMAVLYIQIGYDQVDVNVHPAKREIKFFNHQAVYQAVSRAVANGLSTAQKDAASYTALDLPKPDIPGPKSNRSVSDFETETGPVHFAVAEQSVIEWASDRRPQQRTAVPEAITHMADNPPGPEEVILPEKSSPIASSRIIGQVMGTYIIAESEKGMVLIDQHAAHERIVYEALKKRHLAAGIVRQDLVVPETIELTHKESDLLARILDDLKNMGLEIEPFGGTTYIIKSIPDLISEKQVQSLVVDIIETSGLDKNAFAQDKWLDECLILMACHNALRANQTMHHREMVQLLADLENCDNPMHCPHGRPIMITLTIKELEKLFKRVV